MTLKEASEAYQAQLELLRTHPDHEQLREDCAKARAQLEVSWLEQNAGPASAHRFP